MGAVNKITDTVSSALGTDGGGGGLIGAVEKTGQEIAKVPILKAGVIVAGGVFGGPAGAAVAAALMSRASGNSFNQSLWNGIGTGAALAGATYAAGSLGGASAASGGASAGAPGTFVPGVGAGEAGYVLTGDAIADTAMLSEMGYSGTQAASLASGGAGLSGMSGVFSNLGSGVMSGIGGMMNANTNTNIANTQADAQIRAAQIAADAAKFKPVGVTTNFGQSDFAYDANGNLVAAGYRLNPMLQGQQAQIMNASGGLLNQYLGAKDATAPMGTAAQRAMTLGNQYLATDPQAQAQKYYNDQMTMLSGSRATDMANLQARLAATGRTGLMVGGDAGMSASNPELQAYYNAQLQQDRELAANATQGGMDYAKFGAGLTGTGGDLLSSMYGVQTSAASPYTTALGTANTIEGMGQNAMDLGTSIGASTSTANANAGQYLNQGMLSAAQIQANAAQQNGNQLGKYLTMMGKDPAVQNAVGSGLQSGWDWLKNYSFGS